jgi:hypothetical protein
VQSFRVYVRYNADARADRNAVDEFRPGVGLKRIRSQQVADVMDAAAKASPLRM